METVQLAPCIYFQKETTTDKKFIKQHIHVLLPLPPRAKGTIYPSEELTHEGMKLRTVRILVTEDTNPNPAIRPFYTTITADDIKSDANKKKFMVIVIDKREGVLAEPRKVIGDHDDGDGFPFLNKA